MSEAISEDNSKHICSHMNEDHAASVLGMVLNANPVRGHISNCKMKSIALEGCSLSYVVCNKDMCEQHTVFIKFSPPLRSEKEARYVLTRTMICQFMYAISACFELILQY